MKCPTCNADLPGNPASCCYCGAKFRSSADAYVPPPQKKTDAGAIWALVLSIAGLFVPLVGWLVSIAALVLSRGSSQRIRQSGGSLTGKGAAVAGFVLGILGVASGVIQWLVFVF